MKRGNWIFLPFAIACVLAAGCAPSAPMSGVTGQADPDPARSILVSVLADRIYLVDPESRAWATVVEGLTDYQAGFAAWAPGHRRFAYGDGGIIIVDADSGKAASLAAHQGLSMPAWSPDGTSIAYGDGRNLWITPADRLQARYVQLPLTIGPLAMAWSPAGRITFEGLELRCHVPTGCTSTDRRDVWIVRPDGTGLARITAMGGAGAPKWSADGRRLAFIRYTEPEDGAGELWLTDADGSDTHRVTELADVLAVDWSPDGANMVMVRRAGARGKLQLWITDGTGGRPRAVGHPIPGTAVTVDW
jgi:Tol biopolymer transport system component